ncbi:hypothetical protein HYY74_03485 [Candidatus Woesearchaeota archaeon]|nr:hypothetical protein [Candidatus Woesearchaeota archaeon]
MGLAELAREYIQQTKVWFELYEGRGIGGLYIANRVYAHPILFMQPHLGGAKLFIQGSRGGNLSGIDISELQDEIRIIWTEDDLMQTFLANYAKPLPEQEDEVTGPYLTAPKTEIEAVVAAAYKTVIENTKPMAVL